MMDGSARLSTGTHTAAAAAVYRLSPYPVSPALVRAVALVKTAAAACNADLGFLSGEHAAAIESACRRLRALDDAAIEREIPLDAFQGGAGTSTNMAVNEWVAAVAAESLGAGNGSIHPLHHVNLHQSTNDVMPTALRLHMHDRLSELEHSVEALQTVLQNGEESYEAVIKPARTQLREALTTTMGRQYAVWAHAIGRDRWRCFKARERIREVNLGATAVGTGAGAPRQYVLTVVRYLQARTDHPVCRAEHLGEATANWDGVVEAMEAPRSLAVNIMKIAGDIRLLSSGPNTAVGELSVPPLLRGSSIMAGKLNPVIPEAAIQIAERVIANDGLIARLAGRGELELNAFFPAIAHAVDESLSLITAIVRSLRDYVAQVVPDRERCAEAARRGHAEAVALMPLLSYEEVEVLMHEADVAGEPLSTYLIRAGLVSREHGELLFSGRNLVALGYDEALYASVGPTVTTAIRDHLRRHAGSSQGG